MSRYLPPGAYLPHDAPMLLLEEVVSVSDDSAVCRVTVSPSGVLAPFLDPGRQSPWLVCPGIDGANRRRLVWLASPPAGQKQY